MEYRYSIFGVTDFKKILMPVPLWSDRCYIESKILDLAGIWNI